MNCNLVTELQTRCFNSLLCCKVANLFNQHSKYVCKSFHARSRSRGLIFYCSSTYCYLEVRKKRPFFFLSTAIKPSRNESGSTSGAGQFCTFRLQHPKCWIPPVDRNRGQNPVLWERRSLAQGCPGQRGCSASSGEGGGGLGAAPMRAVPFSRVVI